MKDVFIKYNPYTVETEIVINDERIKENSSLKLAKGTRLQECVNEIPKMLFEECSDRNFKVTFRGTKADFEDLQSAFEDYTDVEATLSLEEMCSVDDAEQIVDDVFKDIRNSKYDEFKTKEIIDAFEAAKSQEFYVNVVATMSSGKSTLINALIGKELMPTANQATTAVIVKIENDDNATDFSAKIYDKDEKEIAERRPVELKDMIEFNNNPDVSEIHLMGNIPFINNSKIKLVLVDTPGPNNSHDEKHQEITHGLLKNTEHSIVLYVMNATQLRTNDDNLLLNYVCTQMNEKGRQSKDRFIFVVNKCDELKPKNDGNIDDFFKNQVSDYLKEHNIIGANMFPASAATALELRCGIVPEDSDDALGMFSKKVKRYPDQFNFNSYTQFSHLPKSAQNDIEEQLKTADETKKLEIYSGITAIEQAIALYIDKYARAIKINDLIQSFEGNVKASEHIAKLKKAILSDKKVAEQAQKDISEIKKKIENGELAKSVSDTIDKRDFLKPFKDKMQKMTGDVKAKLTKYITDSPEKVDKKDAITKLDSFKKEIKQLISSLYSDCGKICEDTLKDEIEKLISDYKERLLKFGEETKVGGMQLDLSVFANFNTTNTFVIFDKYVQKEKIKVGKQVKGKIGGGVGGALLGFLLGGPFGALIGAGIGLGAGSAIDSPIYSTKETVELRLLVKGHIEPLQEKILTAVKDIISQVEKQVGVIKEGLKKEFVSITNKITNELQPLQNAADATKIDKESAIQQNEAKIEWIKSIQERITSISEKIWIQNL
jgi:GTPase SAR1 family protein